MDTHLTWCRRAIAATKVHNNRELDKKEANFTARFLLYHKKLLTKTILLTILKNMSYVVSEVPQPPRRVSAQLPVAAFTPCIRLQRYNTFSNNDASLAIIFACISYN